MLSIDSQEKYLSEHHYDEQVDEDAALRILNFGDDYRNYIDSLSDGLSSCDDKKRTKKKFRKSKVTKLDGFLNRILSRPVRPCFPFSVEHRPYPH